MNNRRTMLWGENLMQEIMLLEKNLVILCTEKYDSKNVPYI